MTFLKTLIAVWPKTTGTNAGMEADRIIDRLNILNYNHSAAKTGMVADIINDFGFAAHDMDKDQRQAKANELVARLISKGFKPYITDVSLDDPSYVPGQITDDGEQTAYKIIGMAMTQLQASGGVFGPTGGSLRSIAEHSGLRSASNHIPGFRPSS